MEGRILKGQFTGRMLSSLSDDDLLVLLEELRGTDEQGAVLIEAYLDRRAQGWREGPEEAAKEPGEGAARRAQSACRAKRPMRCSGLQGGERRRDPRRASQADDEVHPDQGGSTYLAARINEAKDVLLGRK